MCLGRLCVRKIKCPHIYILIFSDADICKYNHTYYILIWTNRLNSQFPKYGIFHFLEI